MWASQNEMTQSVVRDLESILVTHGFYSIATKLQRDDIAKLKELADKVFAYKKAAQERQDESGANAAFVLLVHIHGVCEFLSMWITLKQHKLEHAWNHLVDSQNYIRCGVRLGELGQFPAFIRHLEIAEKTLFPPQIFLSSALQYEWSECSICGGEYGECIHVERRLYMGELCHQIVHEITGIDHVAVVEDPDDKKLRVPNHVSSLSGMHDDRESSKKGNKKRKRKRR